MLLALGPPQSWSHYYNPPCHESILFPVQQSSRSPILSIPPELLHEILIHLDYETLVAARQVCKAFYEVTVGRQFWYTRIKHICSQPGAALPVFPLEEFSKEDLARWTLRRLRVQAHWASPHLSQFRVHLVDCKHYFAETMLLPGGGWMLGLDFSGALRVVDMSRKEPRPQLLFRTSKTQVAPLRGLQIWRDESEERLSFRVAVYDWDCEPDGPAHIFIYRVSLVGYGLEAFFVATPIVSIQESPRQGSRLSLALDENYLLQCCLRWDHADEGKETTKIELRRYTTEPHVVSEARLPALVPPPTLAQVFLLPNNQLGIVTLGFINIYSIIYDNTSLALASLHHVPATVNPTQLSVPFKGITDTYLVTLCENEVKRIAINQDPTVPPTVVKIGGLQFNANKRFSTAFGPSTALFLQSDAVLDVATYSVSNPCGMDLKRHTRPSHLTWSIRDIAAFDESSGRIVLHYDGKHFLVLDLA